MAVICVDVADVVVAAVVVGVAVVVEDAAPTVVWVPPGEDGAVAAALSGETQFGGGAVVPCWPGMSTVPAQPKFENVTLSVWVTPSLNEATDTV